MTTVLIIKTHCLLDYFKNNYIIYILQSLILININIPYVFLIAFAHLAQ